MRKSALTAFLAAMSLTAVPASAMTPAASMSSAAEAATGSSLMQTVDTGCARGYYLSYGRCVPNSRGHRAPRYRYGYYDRPQYFVVPGYGYSGTPRRGCPRGMHPGNSGRCVSNY